VRALMRILEDKGQLKHKSEGVKYIYMPTRPRSKAARSALRNMLRTFFDDSPEKAVAALLDVSDTTLTDAELSRLRGLIDRAGQSRQR